jgi:isoquinoline 1-oxidoreductase beta subunit
MQQSNFHDYKMLRIAEMPVVEVHILDSGQPAGGLGEPGVPSVAPAVTNAIYALTGKRIRQLPIDRNLIKRA